MVAMLLPLLAAGLGGRALGGVLEDWEEDRDINRAAERQTGLLDSLPDDANGDAFSRGAFGAGMMDPQQYAQYGFEDQRQAAQEAAAMARQQVSSAPGMMNARLQRQMWDVEQQERGEMRNWVNQQMVQNGTASQRQAASNPFTPGAVVDQMGQHYIDDMMMTDAERTARAAQTAQNQTIIDTQPGVTAATNAQNQGVVQTQQDVQATREAEDQLLRNAGYVDDVYFTPGPGRDYAVQSEMEAAGLVPSTGSDIVPDIDEALRVLDQAPFDARMWSSTEGINTQNYLNEVMTRLRMDYWQNTLGRSDAPSDTESKQLQELFPEIGGGLRDEQAKGLVRKTLERARARATGASVGADLGEGWEQD